MPIRFECDHCGTKLKAPDGTTGKTTKCLKCARPVTIPEPIYEAEVVDDAGAPEPLGAADFFDVATDDPYDVVGAPATKETGPEQRRPCPMCGEMILIGAAKCRFCGEVFDSALSKTEKVRKKGKVTRDTIVQFRRNIHGLGGFWIFVAVLLVINALVAGGGKDAQVEHEATTFVRVVLSLFAVVFLAIGVLACLKHMWAVYVGIVLTYLVELVMVLSLASSPDSLRWVVILIFVIVQGHRVISMGSKMKKAGIPLNTHA
jgi:hypothetical protein